MSFAVTNTFVDTTTAVAAEVNTNFDDIEGWINGTGMPRDGSVAFTSIPSGPASNPTTSNQLVRKAYVDQYAKSIHRHQAFTGGTEGNATHQVTGSINIVDPGYDIEVWGFAQLLVSPVTIADLANLWELDGRIDSVVVGSFLIPIVQNTQSLACYIPLTTHLTGSDCTIKSNVARIAGSQASLTSFSSSNRSYLDVWYRRA